MYGELSGKIITGNIIGALQHGLHGIQMALLQLPQPGSAGVFTGSGVGNVKDIAQAGSVPGKMCIRDRDKPATFLIFVYKNRFL